MKNIGSLARASIFVCAVVMCLGLAGCAGSDHSDVLNVAAGDFTGTWQYIIENSFEATFTNCTGDATVLEGEAWVDAQSLAPICAPGTFFEVVQSGDSVVILQHAVSCGTGGDGEIGAVATMNGNSMSGEWGSTTDGGVDAVQPFTASANGQTFVFSETSRTFSGTFQGSCDLAPALIATASVL